MLSGRLGPRARWIITDRHGGRSRPPYATLNLADHVGDDAGHVEANRAAAAALLGVPATAVVHVQAVHGREVGIVAEGTPSAVPGVDALVTATPGIALAALAADCVPVLLADSAAGVVGVAHAGWRGVRDDVVGEAVAAARALGAGPGLEAVIGPAICGSCYPVPGERMEEVAAVLPAAAAVARGGGPALDLRAGLLERLAALGVPSRLAGGCTAEDPALFSYRRDGITGRHGAMVVLEPDGAAAGTLVP